MTRTTSATPGEHATPADLARANRALRMLSDSNQSLIRATSEKTLLHDVCRIAVEIGGYRMAWIGFAEADANKTVRPAAVEGFDAGYLESAGFTWGEGAHGAGPAATAIRTGQPCILRDLQKDPAYAPWREAARARGYLSAIALPLTHDGKTFGVLKVYSSDVAAFDEDEVRILLELSGDVAYGVVALRTRSERDGAMSALEESDRRHRSIMDSMTEGVILHDKDGRITSSNPAAERILARSAKEILGRCLHEPAWAIVGEDGLSLPPDELPPFVSLRTAEPRVDVVLGVLRPGGQRIWLSVNSAPLVRPNEQCPYAAVTTFHDITQRRRTEDALRQAQKMEAVGQLAGGIAHDFNNVLAVVQMQCDLVMEDPNLCDETLDGVRQIMSAAERAANLTRQLLTFSRRDVSRPRNIDFGDVLTTLLKMLRRVLGEHIALDAKVAPLLPLLHADAGMMEQVILNLAINARDAMPGGGKLLMEVDAVDVPADVAALHAGASAGRHIRFTVTDTGIGIAPEHLDRIFEPFFTTKEVGRGTGLGLATVFGIVERHHGFVEVESEPGHGARFRVLLPALTGGVASAAAPGHKSRIQAGTESILLVEDEPVVRALAQTVLERKGYRVVEAENAAAALEAWDREKGTFDLLLTDLVMPGSMTGRQLAEVLLARAPSLKVIYCSGYSSEIVDRMLPFGKHTFLNKPYSAYDLATAVRQCLDAPSSRSGSATGTRRTTTR